MGKKITLAIFAGIAAMGLLLTLTGFVMGGRPGSLRINGGDFVYQTSNESVNLGRAPSGWDENMVYTIFGGAQYNNFSELSGIGESFDDWHDWHWASDEASAESREAGEVELGFTAGDVEKLEMEISAGYVYVSSGSEFSLRVNGPLACTVGRDDGGATIKADYDLDNVTTHNESGRPRFYHNGEDVTTEYFLTVPSGFENFDCELDMGVMTLSGLVLNKGEASTSLGTLLVEDCSIREAEIATDLGAVEVTGFSGETCKLAANLGVIEFRGDVSRRLAANCELGSVQATLPRPNDYGYEVEVELGSVSLDGKVFTTNPMNNHHEQEYNKGATPFFDLDCGLGSIDIDFE